MTRARAVWRPGVPDNAHLAIEEARLDLDRGDDYLGRLAAAREGLTDLPRGASIRDRFIANLPSSIGTFAIIATVIWVVRW